MRKLFLAVRIPAILIAVYSLLTVSFFYPVLNTFSTHLIGPPEDNMKFLWFLWYGTKALTTTNYPFFHTYTMYFPEGMNLYYANYFYVGVITAYFLKPFLTLIQTYNLLVLSGFVLSGVSAYYLIHYVTRNATASFIGGFIYAFNPSHFAKSLHHAHLASIQFIPAFILFLLRSRANNSIFNTLMAALFLALAALCDWNYLVYGLVILAFDLIVSHFEARKFFSVMAWARFFKIGMFTFGLLSFLIIPMIRLGLRDSATQVALPGVDIYVADLAGFVLPHTTHWVNAYWEKLTTFNSLMTGNGWEKTVYLGWINLVLAALFISYRWKEARYFGWLLVGTLILAMGIRVHLLGLQDRFTIPLPYQFLEQIPFIRHARNPARIIVFSYAFLAILTAGGIAWLLSQVRQNVLRIALAAGLFILIFADFYQTTRDTTAVELPDYYDAIREDYDASGQGFGILDIPWDQARYGMYQILHEIPNVQGYLGHKIGQPLIGKIPFQAQYLPVQKTLLTANRVKYVILHKERTGVDPNSSEGRAFARRISMEAANYAKVYEKEYEGADAVVFRVYS